MVIAGTTAEVVELAVLLGVRDTILPPGPGAGARLSPAVAALIHNIKTLPVVCRSIDLNTLTACKFIVNDFCLVSPILLSCVSHIARSSVVLRRVVQRLVDDRTARALLNQASLQSLTNLHAC